MMMGELVSGCILIPPSHCVLYQYIFYFVILLNINKY